MEGQQRIYHIYYCTGSGKTYRESVAYSAQGDSYIDAAKTHSDHLRKVSCLYKNIDSNWKYFGRRKGYPKNHLFVTNDNGDKWLVIL